MSRLPNLQPSELKGSQRAFYDELSSIVSNHFGNHFITKTPIGSFIGPFGIFMHTPTLGRPFFDLTLALSTLPGLSPQLREIAILTVGTQFRAAYELYAHENVARNIGVSPDLIEQILDGRKPESGSEEDIRAISVVYDVSRALIETPGPLKQELYDRAIEVLGRDGTVALIQVVGFYAYTCVILNGFDARVPV